MKVRAGRIALLFAVSMFVLAGFTFGQEVPGQRTINYNTFYQFPFSIGVEYQSLSPLYEVDEEYGINDITLTAYYPIPRLPFLQPVAHLGIMQFDSKDKDEPDKWDHLHIYGTVGLAYLNRFSKTFEVGADLTVGISDAFFQNLDPLESRSSMAFLASLGGRGTFNPSYNLSLSFHATLESMVHFTPLKRYNGFLFGIGITASYRFGKDPDSPQAIIRSIKFGDETISDLFAAMQSYYIDHPIGQITITNTEEFAIQDVNVAFYQAGFMDTPTKAKTIPEMEAGESVAIDLFALFNQEVFSTEGITPLTGEVSVEYLMRNKAAKQVHSVGYDLHDKTALTWDDDQKVGAFITPADSALRNYTSYIRQVTKNEVVPGLSEPVQIAMQVFSALKELGCLYQIDPTSPFTAAQENPMVVDSVSLARNTLQRLTGDCDDLTVLYCSLLETVGIETAFITVPGHIYAAFNTKVQSRDFARVHPDQNMTINVNGELWIPVEITLIGEDDFMSAWRLGMEEYAALDAAPEKRALIFTKKAQEIYRPVGLKEADLGLQYGDSKKITREFGENIDKLIDTILEEYESSANNSNHKKDFNQLGIVCAQYGRYDQAEDAFLSALSIDRNYLNPKINLGNVYFMRQDFQEALRSFHSAERYLMDTGKVKSATYSKVLLNISRSYYELENFDKATQYYDKLAEVDPDRADRFQYLSGSEPASRAADARLGNDVLFADEE